MSSKLSERDRRQLIGELCDSLLDFHNSTEMAEALMDLLYPKEIESIAKRLKIAKLLTEGSDYDSIRQQLKVGYSTIARVNTWLNLSGKGFAHLFKRRSKKRETKGEEEVYDPWSWGNVKRRYSMHFWPQLLLEELIKQSDKKEKEKIGEILDKLKIKASTFNSEANKELYRKFSNRVG